MKPVLLPSHFLLEFSDNDSVQYSESDALSPPDNRNIFHEDGCRSVLVRQSCRAL